MKTGFILRRLRRRALRQSAAGTLCSLLFGFLMFACTLAFFSGGPVRLATGLIVFGLLFLGLPLSLREAIDNLRTLLHPERHPDLVALTRYGRLADILAEIDRELEFEAESVVHIGRTMQSFEPFWIALDNLDRTEVFLSKSWLIHLRYEGGRAMSFSRSHRMNCLRLQSIVLVHRPSNAKTGNPESKVILMDQLGVKVEISGKETGVSRLLAELLSRVPWALTRFDTEVERTWQQDRSAILAAVDHQPEQIQQDNSEITQKRFKED